MPRKYAQRFRVIEFTNPRTGSISWRVTGLDRTGKQLRENFSDQRAAQARQIELEAGFLGRSGEETLRMTKLSQAQVRLAEAAFLQLDDDGELLSAVRHWIERGRAEASRGKGVRLDAAAEQFKAWVEATPTLRDRTKANLKIRIGVFASELGNAELATITPERIEGWLSGRGVSARTKINDKLAVSRFLAWCIERPRRWLAHNPAREVRVEAPPPSEPAILPLRQCAKLLVAAKRFEGGLFVRWITLQLFGAMRPSEAARVRQDQINLADREIRLAADQTKTKRARTVPIEPVLGSWLRLVLDKPVGDPETDRRAWARLLRKAGIGRWTEDVLRHTAISHHFRRLGSYGQVAELAGNSERIIKAHYQGRVNSAETARFFALFPTRAERAKARASAPSVIAFPTAARRARARNAH